MHANPFLEFSQYASPRPFSYLLVMRECHIPQKIDSLSVLGDRDFSRMERKFQATSQKQGNAPYEIFKIALIVGYDDEIIRIAGIVFDFQFMFHELVEFVHINISKKLGCEIANRHALRAEQIGISARKAAYYFFQKPCRFIVFDFSSKDSQKDAVVDSIEKLPDIAFEHVARMRIVFGYFSDHIFHCKDSLVGAFSDTAGKRSRYERWFVDRIQYLENGVMKYPIPHRCLMDMPTLRVMYVEIGVRIMHVRLVFQMPMQLENLLFEIFLQTAKCPFSSFFPA